MTFCTTSPTLLAALMALLVVLPVTSHAAVPVSPKPAPITVTAAKSTQPAKRAMTKPTPKRPPMARKVAPAKAAASVIAAKSSQAKLIVKPVSPAPAKPLTPAAPAVKTETAQVDVSAKERFNKPGDITRQVELDGYRWMLPSMFGKPQHEIMHIPADEQKSRMIPLSMYSFTTQESDKAFMSSFNEADIKDMSAEQLKSVLESSKVSYIKEIPNPEELNSSFTTFQGHPAILFDVKETTKSGLVFYSKVMGLLKPGGYYQFAFVSHDQADLAQPWVQNVFDSIRFVK